MMDAPNGQELDLQRLNWLGPEDLGGIYRDPVPAAMVKVATEITKDYAAWIEAARFCVVATAGPGVVDASPRGDDGPVVRLLDARHIALPDWQGNNRVDSIQNIVHDGRISLMFLIRGGDIVIRVRGRARVTDDQALRDSFAREGKAPRSVIVTEVDEVYFQCSRAIMRSGLWQGVNDAEPLPKAGMILSAMSKGEVGGAAWDAAWPERALGNLW